jgi:hypothetical protein
MPTGRKTVVTDQHAAGQAGAECSKRRVQPFDRAPLARIGPADLGPEVVEPGTGLRRQAAGSFCLGGRGERRRVRVRFPVHGDHGFPDRLWQGVDDRGALPFISADQDEGGA